MWMDCRARAPRGGHEPLRTWPHPVGGSLVREGVEEVEELWPSRCGRPVVGVAVQPADSSGVVGQVRVEGTDRMSGPREVEERHFVPEAMRA